MDVEGEENEIALEDEVVEAPEATTTDECPPPPCYYRRFKDIDMLEKIAPPSLDSVKVEEGETLSSTLRKNTYGGLVGQMQQAYVYNDDLNYKEALKEQLNGVLKTCMNMVSSVPPTQPVETYTTAIQASLEKLHELLGEYRAHEARGNLIRLRDTQLEELRALETSIQAVGNEE